MSTLVAFTGFEYGTSAGLGFGPFDGVTGTLGTDVQVIAGAAYEGNYGLQVALTAKGPFWSTATLGTAKTSLVVSLRVRFSTLPTTDTDFISIDVAATTDRAGFFYRASDAKIVAWAGASTQASAASVSVNTWYLLQWHLDVSANPLLMSWSLDGVAGTQVSLAVAASTISRLQLGNRSAGTGTAQYDAVVVSTTGADYPLGAHSIKILSVDPAGTATTNSATNFRRFTVNGTIDGVWSAADARDAVDELPPTIGASADGAVQISNNTSGYMEFPMTTYTLVGGESIAGLRMLACGWAGDATAATIEFRSYNGTTETVVYALADPGFDASTTAPAWVAARCTLADFDTQAELDALAFRAGFSSDAAPDVGVHAIYAELAILPSTGSQSADATLTATATVTAAANSTKPADSTLTGTATITPVAASTKPVTATLTATATATAAATSDKPVTATSTTTAAVTAAAAVSKPVDASLTATATITAAASVGAATVTIDASPTFTATVSAAATSSKPGTASLTGTASIASAATAVKPVLSTLTVTASLTAAASVTAATSPITVRPSTGTTGRPASGITARPFTGTTARP